MNSLTYQEVGATRDGDLPAGYSHLRCRTLLGHDVLDVAAEALMTWRMHEAMGVRIVASAPRAAPGVTVTVGRFGFVAPCRIVWTVADEHRVGWAYGTLPGHPECGEEAFLVERADDGRVWLTVTAFSRPARWYTRWAGPIVPVLQRLYARRCGQVLRRLAKTG